MWRRIKKGRWSFITSDYVAWRSCSVLSTGFSVDQLGQVGAARPDDLVGLRRPDLAAVVALDVGVVAVEAPGVPRPIDPLREGADIVSCEEVSHRSRRTEVPSSAGTRRRAGSERYPQAPSRRCQFRHKRSCLVELVSDE